MPQTVCTICAVRFEKDNLEDHIAELHSNPDKKVGNKSEADYLREHYSKVSTTLDVEEENENASIPIIGPLEEIGINLDDVAAVKPTVNAGASMTAGEAKLMFEAVESHSGFRIDRPSFLVNFLDWGFRTSFSEELSEAGGFSLESHNTIASKNVYVKVETLHNAINDYFGARNIGRQFTFRRLGRYLGPSISVVVERNLALRKFLVEGSPMSNRLGVPAVHFLAVSSIFEYIKPYGKWSDIEKKAWLAHNKSIVKLSNTNNSEFMPMDLRPSPSQAGTLVDENLNDFGKSHFPKSSFVISNKGASLYDKMTANTKKPGETGGLGL